jgi:hypothetical protein
MDSKETKSKYWWSKTSESERESIRKGISEAVNGDLKPHSEAQKIYGKWL